MLKNRHPVLERHPQNNSIMPEIMLDSLSSLTKWCNGAKRHYEVAIKPFNMLILGSKNFSVQLSYLCNYYYFFHYYSLYAEKKNGDYAGIILDSPTIALCLKLCRVNASSPSLEEAVYGYPFNFYATGSWYLDEWAREKDIYLFTFPLGIKETVLIWILELEVVKSQITIWPPPLRYQKPRMDVWTK